MGSDKVEHVPAEVPTLTKGATPAAAADGTESAADSKVVRSPKPKGRPKREPKVDIGSPDWKYEDLVICADFFRDECGLRGVGIDPWKENGVDTKKLEEVFNQKKDSSNGFVVPKTDPDLPWDTVVSLCQVIDRLVKTPVNGRMGVALARGLYFEFKLRQDVNWAKFAHDKHLNQLHSQWRSMAPKPTEPPYIRSPQSFHLPGALAKTSGEEQELYGQAALEVEVLPTKPLVAAPSAAAPSAADSSSLGDFAPATFPDLLTPEKKADLPQIEVRFSDDQERN